MRRSIENPGKIGKILDRFRGISPEDRKLAQEAEIKRPGEGEIILEVLSQINRYNRNPFRK